MKQPEASVAMSQADLDQAELELGVYHCAFSAIRAYQ